MIALLGYEEKNSELGSEDSFGGAGNFSNILDNLSSFQNVTNIEPIEDIQRFLIINSELRSLIDEGDLQSVSWARISQETGIVVDVNDEAERDFVIQSDMISLLATRGAVQGEEEEGEGVMEDRDLEVDFDRYVTEEEQIIAPQRRVDSIEFTQETIKWRGRAQGSYKDMFDRRIKQLVNGERSYTLSKRLKHCSMPLYESKLFGYRILWTPVKRGDTSSILVWCVSNHDDVPRRMDQINKVYSKHSRQAHELSNTEDKDTLGVEAALRLTEDEVSVDPFSNTLLKLYTVNSQDLSTLWQNGCKPQLKLSRKQIEIDSQTGTVLLLGQSGTGKTKHISARMLSDRDSPTVISQLFVSRSRKLCELVEIYQTDQSSEESLRGKQIDFMTLDKFISQMERAIAVKLGPTAKVFSSKRRVDFEYFRNDLFPHIKDKDSPDALTVWIQIRSSIKGSLEAALLERPLNLEEYLDLKEFGKYRCRLGLEQRKKAYVVYQSYEREMWDDSVRVLDLLIRSQLKRLEV